MRIIGMTLVVVFAAGKHKRVKNLVDELFERTRKASSVQHVDLVDTALGKSAKLSIVDRPSRCCTETLKMHAVAEMVVHVPHIPQTAPARLLGIGDEDEEDRMWGNSGIEAAGGMWDSMDAAGKTWESPDKPLFDSGAQDVAWSTLGWGEEEKIPETMQAKPNINKELVIPSPTSRRIKRKKPNVTGIEPETVALIAQDTQAFLDSIVSQAYRFTAKDNRKTVSCKDILRAVKSNETLVWLDTSVCEQLAAAEGSFIDRLKVQDDSTAEAVDSGVQRFNESGLELSDFKGVMKHLRELVAERGRELVMNRRICDPETEKSMEVERYKSVEEDDEWVSQQLRNGNTEQLLRNGHTYPISSGVVGCGKKILIYNPYTDDLEESRPFRDRSPPKKKEKDWKEGGGRRRGRPKSPIKFFWTKGPLPGQRYSQEWHDPRHLFLDKKLQHPLPEEERNLPPPYRNLP